MDQKPKSCERSLGLQHEACSLQLLVFTILRSETVITTLVTIHTLCVPPGTEKTVTFINSGNQ